MKKKNNNWKIILKAVALLIFTFIVFSSGAYLAVHNDVIKKFAEKEVLYSGKITGKYDYKDGVWSQNVDFDLYWDVWDMLKREHVDRGNISEKELFYGSLRGLVSSVGDPYSEFMDPVENKEFEEDMSGSFEGIGAEIGIREGVLTIVSPISGTPADRAGLMPGDMIIEIDGESTKGMNINEAVSRIRGPRGEEVVLSIFRDGLDDILDIKIIRDTIVIKSVEHKDLGDGLFLIKISAFNSDTEKTLNDIIVEISEKEVRGVIIDLRNNPGGYLETAISILGEWISGEIAMIEDFGNGNKVKYTARGLNRLNQYNNIVLINGGSASASEIIAGALSDYGQAVIIGEKSYGKGSVQALRSLKDGSALKITMAKWLTPSGRDINEKGIIPDIEVELTYDDYRNDLDPQLDAAIKFFKP
jgi:carboxyl-terminal processing protease